MPGFGQGNCHASRAGHQRIHDSSCRHFDVPHCCAAISAAIEGAGLRARFPGQNAMAKAIIAEWTG
eukprot:5964467-Pyramimonas_sp.AAC.1